MASKTGPASFWDLSSAGSPLSQLPVMAPFPAASTQPAGLSGSPPSIAGLKLLLWGWLLGELSAVPCILTGGRKLELLGGMSLCVGLHTQGVVREFTSPGTAGTCFLRCKFWSLFYQSVICRLKS